MTSYLGEAASRKEGLREELGPGWITGVGEGEKAAGLIRF